MFSIKTRKKSLLWSSLGFAIALIFLALQPSKTALLFLKSYSFFPLAHAVAYGVFCFLLCLYFRFNRMNLIPACCLALFLTFICGAVSEAAQIFTPDRTPDIMDVKDDMQGAFVAVLSFLALLQMTMTRKKHPRQLELFNPRTAV